MLLRVLLVDDDDDMRALARAALERHPRFEVIGEGVNGAEGIVLAERGQPDVVLLDLEMPWLDGAETVPFLREVSPGSTIVLWTVSPDSPRATAACDLGASAVLDKAWMGVQLLPVQLAKLLDSLGQPSRTRSSLTH